jgi:hypothetical protein
LSFKLFCKHEHHTSKYFAAQLCNSEKDMAEKHIAGCNICCDTLAHLARIMFSEESPEETLFLAKSLHNITTAVRQLLNLP